MPQYTQDRRLLLLDTPLGKDKLLLRSFSGEDQLSQLFTYDLDLLSEDSDINFDDIVGKNVTVSIKLPDDRTLRHFNGFVSRFSQSPGEGRFAVYQAEVVPWLWFLTRTADCKIFQNMSVPDIVKKVFSDFGFSDFEDRLTASYTTWEYCVQYRETACNFVMRLMEEEGIYFFFEHDKGRHTLVMADAPSAHKPCPLQSKLKYRHADEGGDAGEISSVSDWRSVQELRPGKWSHNDYNFQTPNANLETKTNSIINQGGNDKYEIYDYPGEYETRAEGEAWVKVRMEEDEAPHEVISGASVCRTLGAGFKFDLSEHPRRDQNTSYVLTSVTHSAHEGGTYTDTASADLYGNGFQCIKAGVKYRPPRSTPKPYIRGTQTALVVGPSGEEIWVDKFGRVKVHFYWDRYGKKDENDSCWIRVSQLWAGKAWGAMWIPRIGQEVVVDFIEGDPDRPLITGRVYNADQTVPYTLPDEQTKSTIKSRSSKGGGADNFNELRFEDKKGNEQIFMNAEKDMDLRVENDEREWVGEDRHLIIKRDQKELVERYKYLHVKKDQMEAIDGGMSLSVGGDRHTKIGQVDTCEAGTEIHLKAGTKVIVEAGTQISLKVGGNFVDISAAGVTIVGTMVKINSGGSAGSGTDAKPGGPKDPDVADDGTKTGKLN